MSLLLPSNPDRHTPAVSRCLTSCSWHWRNCFIFPVLKHGPRSQTCARVWEWISLVRNESISGWTFGHNPPALSLQRWGPSMSVYVWTRKVATYAWVGWNQGKLWWRLVPILTCKSIVKSGYRGERLIEPSGSLFPPKFTSGQLRSMNSYEEKRMIRGSGSAPLSAYSQTLNG
jgi:hypothetical protein